MRRKRDNASHNTDTPRGMIHVNDIPPELLPAVGLPKARAKGTDRDVIRRYACKVLAQIAELQYRDWGRVLKHAQKMIAR